MEYSLKYCRLVFLFQILRHVAITDCNLNIDFDWTTSWTSTAQSTELKIIRRGYDFVPARQPDPSGLGDEVCIYTDFSSKFYCLTDESNEVGSILDNGPGVLLNTTGFGKFFFEWHHLEESIIPENPVRYGRMADRVTYVARKFVDQYPSLGVFSPSWSPATVRMLWRDSGSFVWRQYDPPFDILVFKVTGVVLLGGYETAMNCSDIKSLPLYDLSDTGNTFGSVLDGNKISCFDLNNADEYRFDLAIPEQWSSVENIEIVMEGEYPRCDEPMFMAYTVSKNDRSTSTQCHVTQLTRNEGKVTCGISCVCRGHCFMLFLHVLNQHWSPSKITKSCEIYTENAREISSN